MATTCQQSGGPPWAAGEKDESGRKTQGRLPGGRNPPGWRAARPGEAEPTGLCSRRVTRLARAALSAPRRPVPLPISVPRPGEPYRSSPLTPQPSPEPPVGTGTLPAPPAPGVLGPLRRPAPAPRREPSGTRCGARGCCVGRSRPSGARRHASAARKLLESQRPARPVTGGVGRVGAGGAAARAAGRWGRSRLFWACTGTTSSPAGTWETAASSIQA